MPKNNKGWLGETVVIALAIGLTAGYHIALVLLWWHRGY